MRTIIALLSLSYAAIALADRPLPDTTEPTPDEPIIEIPAAEDLSSSQAMEPTPDVVPVAAEQPEASTPVPQQVPVEPPNPFEATYKAKISGARGEATMRLAPLDTGRFIFHSDTRARGVARLFRSDPIIECSVFQATTPGGWQAQRYRYRDGRKDSDINFDADNQRIDTRYRDESSTLSWNVETTDRLLEQLIVSRAIVDGEEPGERAVVDRGSLQTIIWTRLANESIEVGAGRFDTIKYRRSRTGSKRSSLIWFAPKLDGVPVRIEQYRLDDRQAVATLERFADAATLQARGTVTPVCP